MTNKPRIVILHGLPASGKTTYAQNLANDPFYPRLKRVNRDDIRAMLMQTYLTSEETFVRNVRDVIITMALQDRCDVVSDDTNLSRAHSDHLESIARRCDADVLHVFLDCPIDECVRRDAERTKPVGEQAIRDMAAMNGIADDGRVSRWHGVSPRWDGSLDDNALP